MTLDELRALARARIGYLTVLRNDAVSHGDASYVSKLEEELAETEATLLALESL